MRLAFRLGAEVAELDVHLTAVGPFTVFHDWIPGCRINGQRETRGQTKAFLTAGDAG